MSELITDQTSDSRHWFVLYTRSRYEKKVADRLRRKGLEVFCPLIRTRRKWSDRVKVVEEPLFRSYCFVRLSEKDRALVFDTPGVVRYVMWLRRPAIARPEEIQAIKDMLNSHDHSTISVRKFNQEDRVRIKTGVFSEMTGEVQGQKGEHLQIYLEALQMVVSVDLRTTFIEAAHP